MRLSTPSLCLWSPAKPNPTRGSALCVKNDQKRSQPPPPRHPRVLWLASYGLLTLSAWPIRGRYEDFAIFLKQCWIWLDPSQSRTPGLLGLHGQEPPGQWPQSPGASKDNLFPSAAGNQPGVRFGAKNLFIQHRISPVRWAKTGSCGHWAAVFSGGMDLLLCITTGTQGPGHRELFTRPRTLVAVVLVAGVLCVCNTPDYIKIGISFVSHNCSQLLRDGSYFTMSHRENHFEHVADTSRVLIWLLEMFE